MKKITQLVIICIGLTSAAPAQAIEDENQNYFTAGGAICGATLAATVYYYFFEHKKDSNRQKQPKKKQKSRKDKMHTSIKTIGWATAGAVIGGLVTYGIIRQWFPDDTIEALEAESSANRAERNRQAEIQSNNARLTQWQADRAERNRQAAERRDNREKRQAAREANRPHSQPTIDTSWETATKDALTDIRNVASDVLDELGMKETARKVKAQSTWVEKFT